MWKIKQTLHLLLAFVCVTTLDDGEEHSWKHKTFMEK
jgi:hypothetical protein